MISKTESTVLTHPGGAADGVGKRSDVTAWGIGFASVEAAKARIASAYFIVVVEVGVSSSAGNMYRSFQIEAGEWNARVSRVSFVYSI